MGASKKNRRTDYLVQWKGTSKIDASYERDVDLRQFEDKVNEYLDSLLVKTSHSSDGKCLSGPQRLTCAMAWTRLTLVSKFDECVDCAHFGSQEQGKCRI